MQFRTFSLAFGFVVVTAFHAAPAHSNSCSASATCTQDNSWVSATCTEDDCQTPICGMIAGGVSSISNQMYSYLNSSFNQGTIQMAAGSGMTQSQFLAARQTTYVNYQANAEGQRGCSFTPTAVKQQGFRPQVTIPTCSVQSWCQYGTGVTSTTCSYSCNNPCADFGPGAGAFADLVIGDFQQAFATSTITVGAGTTQTSAQITANQQTTACNLASTTSNAQGCGTGISSQYCNINAASSGRPSLAGLGIVSGIVALLLMSR